MTEISIDTDATMSEPLSPISKLLHDPHLSSYVIAVIGWKTRINPHAIKHGLQHTIAQHPRFSSKMVEEGHTLKWVRAIVNVEDHVLTPEIDSHQEFPDKFVEDYISYMTRTPLDSSKPLWELHLLNIKTSDAEAVGILRVHHSLGDGVSLISLMLANTRKNSDPEALPTLPVHMKAQQQSSNSPSRLLGLLMAILSTLTLLWNTVVDMAHFIATVMFMKDTETSIKAGQEVQLNTKLFVHRHLSLEDVKQVKNATNVTINDVLLGVTRAGLTQYMYRKHGEGKCKKEANANILKNIRTRAAVYVNIRPTPGIQERADMMTTISKARWGNSIGLVLLPIHVAFEDDMLEYVRWAKVIVDRKKHSLEAICSFYLTKFSMKLFGAKVVGAIMSRAFMNTTLSFSNVAGPLEEVSFYGHPISYIAPTAYGYPHALTIHFQSYFNKMTLSLAVDPTVIPDPHRLCDDCEEALQRIRDACSSQ